MLFDVYKNKSVLVTGNTGFKGSWLTIWLRRLGAHVTGFSKDLPSNPNNFEICGLRNVSHTHFGDVRDLEKLKHLVKKSQPDYIFHLAAQSLVKRSYDETVDTFSVNAMGTVNLLEAARSLNKQVSVVMITSDKAYDNVEWKWGYRETDKLGGKDPYSASKGMAELAIRSYFESFIKNKKSNLKIAITRAGNVIGGGDWAMDRIVPDCVRSWSKVDSVAVRNPNATRPWQHVLEPLGGYLTLGAILSKKENLNGEAYNFGPGADQNYSVSQLINEMKKYWENVEWKSSNVTHENFPEAGLLKLNCDKALFDLRWTPTLSFEQCVKFTIEWYRTFYEEKEVDMLKFCENQIEEYTAIAREAKIYWANDD